MRRKPRLGDQRLLEPLLGAAVVAARGGQLGGGGEEVRRLLVLLRRLEQLLRGVEVVAAERGLRRGDQQVMLAVAGVLAAPASQALP